MSPEGRLIFAGLTVEENLKAGAYCIKSAKQYQKNMDRVQELFPILKERRRQQAGTLSGGEQQMLAIGRALMADPEILLLDEHTAALDPKTAAFVLELTRRIVAERQLTALMVTHSLRHALDVGTRTLMLHQGRIVLDIAGAERARLDVPDLLAMFEKVRGEKLADDALLLG